MQDPIAGIHGLAARGASGSARARSAPCVTRWDGATPPTLAEASAYCRRLARTHYENFAVGSWLLPRSLRPHLSHVYAYCRWADDLADEVGDPAASLRLLDWWQEQLAACYEGRATHPVFVALRQTIREFDIPAEPFQDLLVAFRQDQVRTRYESVAQLLDYCRYSANPVGRLVLYIGRCHDRERVTLSDSICSGLQLANLWQDLARDVARGRVYLPGDVCRRHEYTDAMLARRECNDAFRHVLATEVDRAETMLRRGLPLARTVVPELRREVALVIAGGLEVLASIRRLGYDVWRTRPVVGRAAKLRLLIRCWWGQESSAQRGDGP